jgi:hypothetical protein
MCPIQFGKGIGITTLGQFQPPLFLSAVHR